MFSAGIWEEGFEVWIEGQLRVFKERRKPLKSRNQSSQPRARYESPRARDMHAHRHIFALRAIRCALRVQYERIGDWVVSGSEFIQPRFAEGKAIDSLLYCHWPSHYHTV